MSFCVRDVYEATHVSEYPGTLHYRDRHNGVTAGANADVQPHSYADVRAQASPGWLGGSFVHPGPPWGKRRAAAMQRSDSFGWGNQWR